VQLPITFWLTKALTNRKFRLSNGASGDKIGASSPWASAFWLQCRHDAPWKAEPQGLLRFWCRLPVTKQCTPFWWLSREGMRLLATQRADLQAVPQEQGRRGDTGA